jgi:hypothetical protein
VTGGPWRVLLLDRSPDDPKWLFATVSAPADVRPAVLDAAGRYQQWQQVTDWVRRQFPGAIELAPARDTLVWHVTEQRPR